MVGVELDHSGVPRRRRRSNSSRPISPEAEAVERRQREIDHRHDHVDLEAPVGVGLHEVGGGGELLGRDLRGDRRGEHQQHALARQRRIDALHGGQQHDMQDGLQARETQAVGGLELGALDRLDAGTHDLGGVGAHVDGQRDHRRDLGRELQPQAGEAEIDDEDLDQQRRVADRLDVGADQAAQTAARHRPAPLRTPCRARSRRRSTGR